MFLQLVFFLQVGTLALHQTPLFSGRVGPALVASYDMHGRAAGLFYVQHTGQRMAKVPDL